MRSKQIKNIKAVTQNELCNSCGICEVICPEKAIKMFFNEEKGFHEPIVDEKKCTECNKCIEVCQGLEVNFPELYEVVDRALPEVHQIGNIRRTMVLYSSDMRIRKNGASGGTITQLLNFLFDEDEIKGAYVAKSSRETPFEPEGFLAQSKEELLSSQMSIYHSIPFCKSIHMLKEIKGKIAFVGLPCQIHGLLKYLKIYPEIKEKIYCIIGTFCGGFQTSYAHKYYFPTIGINFDDMKYVDYRYGDFPGQLNIGFKNGGSKEFERRFKDEWKKNHYNTAFNSSFYIPRCYLCADKGSALADISAGDPWLSKFENEKVGKSLIVTRTELGDDLVERAKRAGYIISEEAAFKDIMDVQKLYKERHGNQKAYEKFYNMINKAYPKYTYAGTNKIFNRRIYIRVLTDYIRIKLQRKKRMWFILHPLYVLNKHAGTILIYSNPYKYLKRFFRRWKAKQ